MFHGSPADRGEADYYYGRKPDPHKCPKGTGFGERITLTDPAEIKEYDDAYENPDNERKDWR